MNQEIVNFSAQIRSIMAQSNLVTKTALESINILESDIKTHESKMKDLFNVIGSKETRKQNLNLVIKELDLLIKLVESIENDKLGINQGPKGSLNEYIKKLEYLKTMDKYTWLNEINFMRSRNKKFENNIKIYINKYNSLLLNGESLICFEFQNIIKHYSNLEQMKNYIEFILNDFNDESSLFIPNETLEKLEQVCWWFLQREQQYELYNDKNEHCDINEKLKYIDMRCSFLNVCIKTYFKMSSLGYIKDQNAKIKKNINKLFHAATSGLGTKKPEDSSSSINLNIQNDNLNQKQNQSASSNHNPSEYIEIFSENLDFSLKLLTHENLLIQKIYAKSDETRIDLVSKLTILVIDHIQKECEIFFSDQLDFSKLSNITDNVIYSIVQLIIKVQNLKEKTSCLQTEDLSSASKLLQFSIKLNDISSQIFSSFLEAIKTGYLNTAEIPRDSSVHYYCVKICDTWRFILKHEHYLLDSIRLACDANLSTKKKSKDSDEDENLKNYQRLRQNRNNKMNDLIEEESDDFENSEKWYFTKYYSLLIEKLDNFLIEETIKACSSTKSDMIMSSLSLNSVSNNFKNNLKTLKGFLFLVNNLTYMMNFINEMGLLKNLKKLNPNFDQIMNTNIDNNVNRSLEIFKYLNLKFTKLQSLSPEQIDVNNNNINSFDSNESIKRKDSNNSTSSTSSNSAIKALLKYSFDSKKKRDELIFMLKETLSACFNLVIENLELNIQIKDKVNIYLTPVLEYLNSCGELASVATSFSIKTNQLSFIPSLIIEKMFPIKTNNLKI